MKKQFVTYPIALKLKLLGFDEECLAFFLMRNDLRIKEYKESGNKNSAFYNNTVCSAPLWQQAIDWFREEHNIDIIIKPWSGDKVGEKTYAADVFIFGTITYIKLKREGTYEEARDQAILKCIELCQNKK